MIPFVCQLPTTLGVLDVLVASTRPVPRLIDLNPPELASLMSSVQHVGRIIERVYGADGLTVACQVIICVLHRISL